MCGDGGLVGAGTDAGQDDGLLDLVLAEVRRDGRSEVRREAVPDPVAGWVERLQQRARRDGTSLAVFEQDDVLEIVDTEA